MKLSLAAFVGCALVAGCGVPPGDPAVGESDEAVIAKVVNTCTRGPAPTNDGGNCYGACGSGCSYCYTSTVTLPYACASGASGTITKQRLICPVAPCCVEHDGCTRGCGSDLVCQAGCNANAVANGCVPGLVGGTSSWGTVPGIEYDVYNEVDSVCCPQVAVAVPVSASAL